MASMSQFDGGSPFREVRQSVCPLCREAAAFRGARCSACGATVLPDDWPPNRDAPLLPLQMQSTFSLSSLFLLTTLAAVCCGMIVWAPVLGILTAMAAVPALVRVMFISAHRAACRDSLSTWEKVYYFVVSLGLMFVIGFTMVAAFCSIFLVILVAGGEPVAAVVGLVAGGIGAVLVCARLIVLTWPRQERT